MGLVLTFINISSLKKDFVDPSTTHLFDAMSEDQFELFPAPVFLYLLVRGQNYNFFWKHHDRNGLLCSFHINGDNTGFYK